jgi:D-alanyl-D-alanine carboxypeptidase/D-alanyl-D-alanine-endopeptidase (penicillin-binding protein 4)
MLLRETAHVVRGEGTARAGVEEARALLQEAGAAEEEFDLEDGSGLSRRGLLSAWTLAALLRHIEAKGMGDLFRQTLPIAGSDGTLSGRFQGVAEAGGIRAKTGSLAHVAALSGYAEGGAGRRVAFSILVNGYTAPAAEVRALMDKIAIEILKESGQ